MKIKRRICLAGTVAGCLLAAAHIYAGTGKETSADYETVGYVVDFLDYDGSFLDSRICAYGERIEDIPIPTRQEDQRYAYEFIGWEPQFSEIVTESMAYTAVYHRIDKNGEAVSGPDTWELPQPSVKVILDDLYFGEKTQVSASSFDVTSFRVETPGEEKDVRKESADDSAKTQTEDSVLIGSQEAENQKKPPGKSVKSAWTDDVPQNETLVQENAVFAPEADNGASLPEALQIAENFVSAPEEKLSIQSETLSAEAEQAGTNSQEGKSHESEAYEQEEMREAPAQSSITEKSGKKEDLTSDWENSEKPEIKKASMKMLPDPVFLVAVLFCGGSVWVKKKRGEG